MTATDPKQPLAQASKIPTQATKLLSTQITTRRKILSSALLIASVIISVVIFTEAVVGILKSESEIDHALEGAAYEDVFGMGFWPFFMLFTVVQTTLIWLSRIVAKLPKMLAGAVLFSVISLIAWSIDYQRMESLLLP